MAHLEGKRNPRGEDLDCSCFVDLKFAMSLEGLYDLKRGKGNKVKSAGYLQKTEVGPRREMGGRGKTVGNDLEM